MLTNKTELGRVPIRSLPRLKYIGVLATGEVVVDVQAARERKIPVTLCSDLRTRLSRAQMVSPNCSS